MPVSSAQIAVDDPRAAEVRALIEQHLQFVNALSPPEDVHALDLSGLLDPAVTFYSLRRAGTVIAIGALKQLSATHGELKSMHVAHAARRGGFGTVMLAHLIGRAREIGMTRLSLETGTAAEFTPARTMYARAGFVACGPFADYRRSANSAFMTMALVTA